MTATVQAPVPPLSGDAAVRRWDLLIDGEWVKPKYGQTFLTRNPATGEVLAECVQRDEFDIDPGGPAGFRGRAVAGDDAYSAGTADLEARRSDPGEPGRTRRAGNPGQRQADQHHARR